MNGHAPPWGLPALSADRRPRGRSANRRRSEPLGHPWVQGPPRGSVPLAETPSPQERRLMPRTRADAPRPGAAPPCSGTPGAQRLACARRRVRPADGLGRGVAVEDGSSIVENAMIPTDPSPRAAMAAASATIILRMNEPPLSPCGRHRVRWSRDRFRGARTFVSRRPNPGPQEPIGRGSDTVAGSSTSGAAAGRSDSVLLRAGSLPGAEQLEPLLDGALVLLGLSPHLGEALPEILVLEVAEDRPLELHRLALGPVRISSANRAETLRGAHSSSSSSSSNVDVSNRGGL